MRNTIRALAAILALLPALAAAQVPSFPQTVPANSVVGRIGVAGQSGPTEAIPMRLLSPALGAPLNVKGYGANGDATDQTTAIRNAITATPEGGELYFPCGAYAISGTGTEVFLRTKPIYLHAAENCVALTVDGVGNSTDIFRFTQLGVASNPYGWRVSGFKVYSASGTHARHFINFDTTGTNTGILLFPQVDHNTISPLLGNAIYFNNGLPSVNVTGAANNGAGLVRLTVTSTTGMIAGMAATVAGIVGTTEANGTWPSLVVVDATHVDLTGTTFANAYVSGGTIIAANATGGTVNGIIGPLNSFNNAIVFNYGGDSMAIQNNTLAGSDACVRGQQVIGAGGITVTGNNMSCAAGMVVLDGGAQIVVSHNEMEQAVTATESNNCMVDLRGTTRQLDTASVVLNGITAIAGKGNPTPICINNANGAQVDYNKLAVPAAYAAITVGAASTNAKIGAHNVIIQNGTTVPTNASTVTNSGTNTEYAIPSTVPLGAGGGLPYFDVNGRFASGSVSAPLSLSAGVLSCPTCVLISGTAHGDSAYNILSTDRYVYTSANFTAPRTWTLPAANALAAGTTIWVQDARGTVTSTNTLTISRAGADTIDISNTTLVITGAGGGITFTTDGVSNWGTPIQTVSTGGTGRQTLTNHGVLVGAAANPMTQLAVGANGTLLLGATGADPAFGTMSQDCTITAAGVITCTKTNNVSFTAGATAAAGQLPGTATNDNATAGNVGQNIASSCPDQNATITVTIATPAVVTYTAHGLSNSNGRADACPIVFTTTGALPTGITAGTTYWSVPSSILTNTFQIATSVDNALAGTSVNTSGTQSGVQTGTFAVPLTTGTQANVTGISLTAGDWLVWGVANFDGGGTTTVSALQASLSTSSGTMSFTQGRYGAVPGGGAAGVLSFLPSVSLVPDRFSLSGTTTVYMTTVCNFGVSTCKAYGKLQADRIR